MNVIQQLRKFVGKFSDKNTGKISTSVVLIFVSLKGSSFGPSTVSTLNVVEDRYE